MSAPVSEELPGQRAAAFLERAKDLSLAGGSTSIEQERILRDIYKAISFHPDQVPHYMFLGKIYRQALDITSAIFCFRFVLNIQPTNLQARKQLSELLIVRGQELMVVAASVKSQLKFQSSRACFDEALEVAKDDTDAWICKAVCHIHAQELTEAYEAINRAIKTPRKPTAEMYILRAKIYWGRGLTEQGNVDIRVAAMMEPHHPEVVSFFNRSFLKAEILYKDAVKHFTSGNYKEALLAVNHAMHITTEDVKLLILQSKVYRMLGELQSAYDSMLRAKAVFEKAFQGTDYPMELPSDIVLQINLILNDMSIDYASKGNYDKAILLLNKVIKTEQSLSKGGLLKVNHKYFVNRGDCHRALNSLADAVYDYNLALELKPDDWDIKTRLSLTHYLISTVYFNESRFRETQLELDKAIQFNPKVAEYYFIRGRTHYFQSNFQQAYADFKKSLELDNSNNEVREWLSQFDDEQRTPVKSGADGPGAQIITQSAGRKKSNNKEDFTKLPHWKDPYTVRSLKVTDEDMVEMMLLPKKAQKLPVLRMLAKSSDAGDKKATQRAAARGSSPVRQQIRETALPGLSVPPSPFRLDDSALQNAYRASAEVQRKDAQLKRLYATAAEGVTRGPLWDLVETAKALAYANSHPKHRQASTAPLPVEKAAPRKGIASQPKSAGSGKIGKTRKNAS
jgi:tetratricopeptide (TPR) repeat protein